MEENKYKIDFRPDTSIYATYKRLSYKPPYAISEFVDNSTASYFEFKDELENFYLKNNKKYKLNIYILYSNDSSGPSITIRDNAYGMNLENFKRAVILGKPPKKQGGRNEFGMGLKTAATWFSNKWSVKSTALGSNQKYSVTMDIEKISQESPESIDIQVFDESPNKHYTQITLENLNKPLTNKNQKLKLVNLLTGIYRRDINQRNVRIIFAELKNDNWLDYKGNSFSKLTDIPSLKFIPVVPKILQPGELDEIKNETLATKKINGEIIFENKTYKINGFVGIRNEGSRTQAGLTLFRRGRAIVGGYEENYRPAEVFGDSGGFAYQRIYGEIDLDDFPVNQAKDGFSWDNGLEDAFIDFLTRETAVIKNWATRIRKVDKTPVNNIEKKEIQKSNENIKKMLGDDVEKLLDSTHLNEFNSELSEFKDNDIPDNTSEVKLLSNIAILDNGAKLKMTINNSISPKEWISVKIINEKKKIFEVIIYIEHAFFKPYTENKNFIMFIKEFSFAYVSAILKLRNESPDNRIDPIRITKVLNSYLLQYSSNN